MFTCAVCAIHACNKNETDKMPKNCPCLSEEMDQIKELYSETEDYKLARESALLIKESYGKKTRLEEIVDFAKRCDYKHIGLAFCIAFSDEAKVISKVLTYNGLKVNSLICKCGGFSRELVQVEGSEVSMCNPIGQAKLFNEAGTNFNIVLGLCVGHDSLFLKHSAAPATVFAVKDRVLNHKPLEAVYKADTEFRDKLFPPK